MARKTRKDGPIPIRIGNAKHVIVRGLRSVNMPMVRADSIGRLDAEECSEVTDPSRPAGAYLDYMAINPGGTARPEAPPPPERRRGRSTISVPALPWKRKKPRSN